MANIELTQELVKSLFDYKDGYLYWKVSRTVKIKVGQLAGSISHTHSGKRWMVRIEPFGSQYQSRIIFLWHKGYMPKMVDHKDRDTLNNRIENLREADKHNNARNVSKQANKSSKYLGVHYKRSKTTRIVKTTGELKTWVSYRWSAQITGHSSNKVYLGTFDTEEQAALAYNDAAKIYHGEFANLNVID